LSLLNRFPKKQKIYPVYGLIVILIYGWSAYWFIWNLPSWLSFLTVAEIVGVCAYAIVTNFLESLFVLVIVLVLCFCLPAGWLYYDFVFRGAVMVICTFVYIMIILSQHIPLSQIGYYGFLTVTMIVLLVIFLDRVHVFRVAIEMLADRSIIFTYITVPLSVISLFVILVRNAF
jgi:hypothetical protein